MKRLSRLLLRWYFLSRCWLELLEILRCPACVSGIAQFQAAADGDYRLLPTMFGDGDFEVGTADWINTVDTDEVPALPGIYTELR